MHQEENPSTNSEAGPPPSEGAPTETSELARVEGDDNVVVPTPIGRASRELIAAEESYWADLLRLKQTADTKETRDALQETYIKLANHYARLGAEEAAINFLKNALAKREDPLLRHQLGRLQGGGGGFEFIITYSDLIKTREYDLKLVLEFCFFLECHNYHDAAVDILQRELKKKNDAVESDEDQVQTLSGFFLLLQGSASVESRHNLEDYQRVINANFPKSIVYKIEEDQKPLASTIIAQEIEEFDEEHGLRREIIYYARVGLFFLNHYPSTSAIATLCVALLSMSILRISPEVIEEVGTTFAFLLIAWLLFSAARSVRLPKDERLRAHTKFSQNAVAASLAMMIFGYLGPLVIHNRLPFFAPVATKAMSCILVGALFWRTYLSIASIRRLLRKTHVNLVNVLASRVYRRQIAAIVATTSCGLLFFAWGLYLLLMVRAPVKAATFAGLQAVFLLLCWRWGRLEQNAVKRKLRETLVFAIGITFACIVWVEYLMQTPLQEAVFALSLDGVLVLGVATTFALQIGWISSTFIYLSATVFAILNFLPLFRNVEQQLETFLFGKSDISIALLYRGFELAVLLICVSSVIFGRARKIQSNVHVEVNQMEAKYKITGGTQGAVGDNASATQIWQENQDKMDLIALANELATLRTELGKIATDDQHSAALDDLAKAESTARSGDGPGTIIQLKKVGKWAWDAATQVGIGVATAAAKSMLGI